MGYVGHLWSHGIYIEGLEDAVKNYIFSKPITNSRWQNLGSATAKGEATSASDIDLMLVGNDLSYGQIMELLAPVEESLGRTINPTLYTPQDFEAKLSVGNHFLLRVLGSVDVSLHR